MNTVEKIMIKENKTLKLRNVLVRHFKENELIDTGKVTHMMDSYIKAKGNVTIGPMITYSSTLVDESGNISINSKIMIQLKNVMKKVDAPYEIKDKIIVSKCLFARYNEIEEGLQYAYSKLGVYAFENNIKLKGDSYTVFVESKNDKLAADIFMEVQKGDLSIESI